MRSFELHNLRRGSLLILAILCLLLAACAGDKETPEAAPADNSAPAAESDAVVAANLETTPASPEPTAEALAARVNDEPITLAEFTSERERRAFGLDVEPATAAAFDETVLQGMIDQVLIEQYAAREGLAVTDAEVEAELQAQSEIATANGQDLEEFVNAQLYSMDEYRAALRGMMLWQKVSQHVVASVPPTGPQVHARHILVADEAIARSLLDQLNQGAEFAQLALQYSLDSSTAPTGGDLDWVSRGDLLQPEVEDAIFALEPGQRAPEPVISSLGYHIIETLERVEDRPLNEAALAEKREQAFLEWLQSQRDSARIERFVGTGGQ